MKYINQIIKILDRYEGDGYLVGGFVRDYLLNRESNDIDLAINVQVKEVAREFCDIVNGSFVVLDDLHNIYRVVIDDMIYDFTPVVGNSIKEDLLNRDFTINAVAISLSTINFTNQGYKIKKMIDPTNGREDINNGVIRAVNKKVFREDPLRLFRAIRFKAELNFTIEKNTEVIMKENPKMIKDIARERIHDELIKILNTKRAAKNLFYLENEFSLLSNLISDVNELKEIGECKYHREDVWTHSLYAVKKLEQLLEEDYWNKRIDSDKIPLLKFATLFHDLGKLITEEVIDGEIHFYGHDKEGAKYIEPILRELCFSKKSITYIKKIIRYHMRPLSLYYADNLTDKGKYRFFRTVESSVVDVCLLAAADTLSTKLLNSRQDEIKDNLAFLKELIKEWQEVEERTAEPLLTGYDIIEIFSIEEGPQIGEILKEVNEAQAQGLITNYQEAIEYIKNIINQ
ncbi:CCA tRNA nucleotidyltransferase [Selenihalanaerobacter shriftii]|uniref:Poly(A) polymerase n=1 Tax=Selenihalanaerobacter shriftii TaxID=142842 RepID=A0A1T4LQE9_9FIRM|nr:HD domain-containing protein [Selenihalanaerobacter shriftii]SJZ56903.1 poly(A) polymerase [Selenihalanaerobacter shriftii]